MTKINNISTAILIICILGGVITAATTISDTSISVDNFILGGQTIVAYTAALNTKLSGIETLADVTDGTNVNVAGALMESDISDQSFTNLLENGDFESWSAGTTVTPDRWTVTAGAIARSTTHKVGTYGVSHIRSGSDVILRQHLVDHTRYQGQKVTFGCWVYPSAANQIVLRIYDGVGTTSSDYNVGTGAMEHLVVTREIDASASDMYVQMLTSVDGVVVLDGAILVEGSVCPTFCSKSFVSDGIMLQEHTPSSASDYGLTGQWCYDNSYLYICNNTDTWIRTSLTTW